MAIGRKKRNMSKNLKSIVCKYQHCQIPKYSQTSRGQWPIRYGMIRKASRLEEAVFDEVILKVLLERSEINVQILERERKMDELP